MTQSPLILIPVLSAARSTPRLLAPINGVSSLQRTIESAAKDLPEAGIIVSSDDADINDFARSLSTKVEVHERISDGYVENLTDALKGRSPQLVVVLEPTHPFRPRGLIRRTVENLAEREHLDSVVCVRRFTANLWRRERDGEIHALGDTGTGRDETYFQELVGLALATRPRVLQAGRRLGDAVGFEIVDQSWALVDVRDDSGLAVAQALSDTLSNKAEIH